MTIQEIYDLFMEAFEGFQITKECTLQLFREMLRSNDYHPLFSMGAFDGSTNKIIGFVLNNVKTINDKKTAYAILVATKPEYRRQNVMSQIFAEVLPILRREQVSIYYTETKRNNEPAINLYLKTGFHITRSVTTEVTTTNGIRQVEQVELLLNL